MSYGEEESKVYVGSLDFTTTEDDLRATFEQFGVIDEVIIVYDRETGRSRGFGFVTFQNQRDSEEAIKQMDGTELGNRTIKVDKAQAKRSGGGGGAYGGGRGGGRGFSHGGGRGRGRGGGGGYRGNSGGGGRYGGGGYSNNYGYGGYNSNFGGGGGGGAYQSRDW